MKQLDQAIEISEKKTALLKKLKESILFEDCVYELIKHDELPVRYSLFEISSGINLCFGNLMRVGSYVNNRKIDTEKIYNYNKYV
jgi:hypothetical protein